MLYRTLVIPNRAESPVRNLLFRAEVSVWSVAERGIPISTLNYFGP
jgi:hypothetical protein